MVQQTTYEALANLPAATLVRLARTLANGSEPARRVAAAATELLAARCRQAA
jgi:hypothetical protein